RGAGRHHGVSPLENASRLAAGSMVFPQQRVYIVLVYGVIWRRRKRSARQQQKPFTVATEPTEKPDMSANATASKAIDSAWNFVVKVPGGEQKSIVTLKSDGNKLTGTLNSEEYG